VQCEGLTKKLAFDIVLGRLMMIENLHAKHAVFIEVGVTPAYGETGEGERREKVWVYTFQIRIKKAESGGMHTLIVPLKVIKLLPHLTIAEKPKRPRGRPRGSKRANASDSSSESPPSSPSKVSKKRPHEQQQEVSHSTTETIEHATPSLLPPPPKRAASESSVVSSSSLPAITFSDVLETYKKSAPVAPVNAPVAQYVLSN